MTKEQHDKLVLERFREIVHVYQRWTEAADDDSEVSKSLNEKVAAMEKIHSSFTDEEILHLAECRRKHEIKKTEKERQELKERIHFINKD